MDHHPRSRWARQVALALMAAIAIVPAACDSQDDITDRRLDTEKDSPTTAQRPSSTGVPDESTTASTQPADGSLDDTPSSTTISGAEPGRPQLDGEPRQETPG